MIWKNIHIDFSYPLQNIFRSTFLNPPIFPTQHPGISTSVSSLLMLKHLYVFNQVPFILFRKLESTHQTSATVYSKTKPPQFSVIIVLVIVWWTVEWTVLGLFVSAYLLFCIRHLVIERKTDHNVHYQIWFVWKNIKVSKSDYVVLKILFLLYVTEKWNTLYPRDYAGEELMKEKENSLQCKKCMPACSDTLYTANIDYGHIANPKWVLHFERIVLSLGNIILFVLFCLTLLLDV